MATEIRTPNNVYILNKMDKEKYCMGQINAQVEEEHHFFIDFKGGEKNEKKGECIDSGST